MIELKEKILRLIDGMFAPPEGYKEQVAFLVRTPNNPLCWALQVEARDPDDPYKPPLCKLALFDRREKMMKPEPDDWTFAEQGVRRRLEDVDRNAPWTTTEGGKPRFLSSITCGS